jgi:hypothetical protein
VAGSRLNRAVDATSMLTVMSRAVHSLDDGRDCRCAVQRGWRPIKFLIAS